MIDEISYTKEWIKSRRSLFFKNDPSILEKTIHALSLLEKISKISLSFIFKGGTSLLLLLPDFKRFSIDIDIIFEGDKEELEKKLIKIVDEKIFLKMEENKRNITKIPKSHYKFQFYSKINNRMDNILLDVLFEKNKYPKTIIKPIKHPLIKDIGDPSKVTIPSINSILGDKLTAFAPKTTGIKYGIGKNTEIIKQLFDIGTLFNYCSDLKEVKESFIKICENEINYRDTSITTNDVLNDIFNTSIILGMNSKKSPSEFNELKLGTTSFASFAFGNRYNITNSINAASKAAYISKMLLLNKESIEKYNQKNLSKIFIEEVEYNRLNKIKKTDPEAFYYFYKACI